MADRSKVLSGLKSCADSTGALCRTCPYDFVHNENCMGDMAQDALELLKEQQETITSLQGTICKLNAALAEQPADKELHLDDLDMLVNMIAIKAKAEGRFFSPYEVGLALVQHGQHDERFKWGEVIKYSPSEVEQILNEVINDASKNS